ncbi:hypothetical protein ACLFKQ_13485 [Myxosarcina sp. GI1(2024)]
MSNFAQNVPPSQIKRQEWSKFLPFNLVRIIHPTDKPEQYETPEIQDDDCGDKLASGDFPVKTIIGWQEIEDYPDWQEAELAGITLDESELKVILQATDIDKSELNSYKYDPKMEEYYKASQRAWIVHTLLDKSAMYPPRKDKLAGYPHWVQDIEYPNCPTCDRVMNQFIFEFASDDNIPFIWVDVGMGYIVQCPEHKEQVAFFSQWG